MTVAQWLRAIGERAKHPSEHESTEWAILSTGGPRSEFIVTARNLWDAMVNVVEKAEQRLNAKGELRTLAEAARKEGWMEAS